jgi:hypothetical protein
MNNSRRKSKRIIGAVERARVCDEFEPITPKSDIKSLCAARRFPNNKNLESRRVCPLSPNDAVAASEL